MKPRLRILFFAALMVLGTFASGCATATRGTTQSVTVSSQPDDATVRLDGEVIGRTPLTFKARRKTDHLLTLEKPGYQPFDVAITRRIGGAVFGNYLLAPFTLGVGALYGWGTDAASGAQYNLIPATIHVTLRETAADTPAPTAAPSAAARFIDELKILDELHAAQKLTDEEYAGRRAALMEKYASRSPDAAPAAVAQSEP